MSVDFGQNADEKIGMNQSRTIGSPHPQITRTRLSNRDISELVTRKSYLAYRNSELHVTIKSENENLVENLRGNKILKILSPKIILKLKKLGANFL